MCCLRQPSALSQACPTNDEFALPMTIIPWRVKAFLSHHAPLAYHLVVNAGLRGNSQAHWDRMLEESWDDPARAWPTKVDLIASLTRPDLRMLDVACGTG